jgi:putative transposase
MLSKEEFELFCLERDYSEETIELIEQIRNSEPVRLVRGNFGNVTGRYPSRLMGRTLQFESHTVELAAIIDLHYFQRGVREVWDQPYTLWLEYKGKKDRNLRVSHVPDFFVIREDGAGFIECKREEDLIKLSQEQPNKYKFGSDAKWHCPPAERAVEPYGLSYTIISSAEIDRTQVRNAIFLEDYLGKDTPHVSATSLEKIISIIGSKGEILLSELLDIGMEEGVTADDVYISIANGSIFVNLKAEALVKRDKVWVYSSQEAAYESPRYNSVSFPKGKWVDLEEGASIRFGSKVLRIVLVNDSTVYLEGEGGATASPISISSFKELAAKGEIQGIPKKKDDIAENWKKRLWDAGENTKREFARRCEIMRCHLSGQPLPENVPPRTLARRKAEFRSGEILYGNGFWGLFPAFDMRGDRRTKKINSEVEKEMKELIKSDYEKNVAQGMFAVWGKLVKVCETRGLKYPSYVTFIKYIKKRPRYLQKLKRMGHRAAYANQPFYFWIEKDTPRHGDRPFEVAHIDHTLVDLELICPITGENFGRAWATVMLDAACRRFLAVYITYDAPSRASDMMVIRECVRRYNRLPQTIVVDRGSDFGSIYFQALAGAYEITIKQRPGSKPRFGSVMERIFNTSNKQFVHNLLGNTKITRNVREITKSHDPRRLAVWSLGPFYEAFRDWAYNQYDIEKHWTLKQSPREAYATALKYTGERSHRLIPYDEHFKILTLPTTRKGSAKNQIGKGLKINGEYFFCDELLDPKAEGKNLPILFDPFDDTHAYARVSGHWAECFSRYRFDYEGLSEFEIEVGSAEDRRRNRLFSQEMPKRAMARAQTIEENERREKEQAKSIKLLRRMQAENGLIREVINVGYTVSGQSSLLPLSRASGVRVDDLANEQRESLFTGKDFSNLGKLEEYEG